MHCGLSRGYDQDKGAGCLRGHTEPCWKPTLFDCLGSERKGWSCQKEEREERGRRKSKEMERKKEQRGEREKESVREK